MAGTGNLILKRGTSLPFNSEDTTPVLLKGMPAVQINGLSQTINSAGNSVDGVDSYYARSNYQNRLWLGMNGYGDTAASGDGNDEVFDDFGGPIPWSGSGNLPAGSELTRPIWIGAEIRAFTPLKKDASDAHYSVLKADWSKPSDYVLVTQKAIAYAPQIIWAEGNPGQGGIPLAPLPRKYVHLSVPEHDNNTAGGPWTGVKSKKIVLPSGSPAIDNVLKVTAINTSDSVYDLITLNWGEGGTGQGEPVTVTLTGNTGSAGTFTSALSIQGASNSGVSVATASGSATATINVDNTIIANLSGSQTLTNKTFPLRDGSGASGSTALFTLKTGTTTSGAGVATYTFVGSAATSGTIALTLPTSAGTLARISDLPTVNNNTITLTGTNGISVSDGSFTLNQSSNETLTITTNATNTNLASTIVSRDGSGNFSAGTITANLTGNVTGTTTNIAGGAASSIPYQSAANTTTFLAAPGSGLTNPVLYYSTANGIPEWVSQGSLSCGTAVVATTAGIASSVTTTVNDSSNEDRRIPFISDTTSTSSSFPSTLSVDSPVSGGGVFAYNPSTNTLKVNKLVSGNTTNGSATEISKQATTTGDYPVVFGSNTGTLRYDNASTNVFRYDAATQTLHVKNLNVTGAETVTIKQNVETASTFLTLNSDLVTAPTDTAGIIVNRGTHIDTRLQWNESLDRWEILENRDFIDIDNNGISVSLVSGTSYKFTVLYSETEEKRKFQQGNEVIITGLTGDNGPKYNGTWIIQNPVVGSFDVLAKKFVIKNLDFVTPDSGLVGAYKITCEGINHFLPVVGQSVVIANSGISQINTTGTFKVIGTNDPFNTFGPAFDTNNSEMEFYIVNTNDSGITNNGNGVGGTATIDVNSNYVNTPITYTSSTLSTSFSYPLVHTSAPTDANTAIATVDYTATGGEPIQTIYNAKLVDVELNNLVMTGTWQMNATIDTTQNIDITKGGLRLPYLNNDTTNPNSFHEPPNNNIINNFPEGQIAYDIVTNRIVYSRGQGTNANLPDTTGNVAAEIVDTSATQTLINKTLTSPTITGATITTGTINNTAIGGTTANTGAFTTLSASGAASFTNTLAVGGAFTANGNVTLGNSVTEDTLAINATITNTSIEFGTAASAGTNKLTLAIPASGSLSSDITVTLPTWGGTVVVPSGTATSTYLVAGTATQPAWTDPDNVVVGGVFVRNETTVQGTTAKYPIPFLGSSKGDNPTSSWTLNNESSGVKQAAYLYIDNTSQTSSTGLADYTNSSSGLFYEVDDSATGQVGTLFCDYIGAMLDCGTY
jgi:hypothetical protein